MGNNYPFEKSLKMNVYIQASQTVLGIVMGDKDLVEWIGLNLVLDDGEDFWLGAAMLFNPELFEDLF